MSYSFSVVAATKEEATKQIRDCFDQVVVAQPLHGVDREAAVVAAQTLVRALVDPKEDQQVRVSMNGSLSWRNENEFTSANLNITTSINEK